MPTLSIEILCPGAIALVVPEGLPFGTALSCPPRSDRGPSPLWEEHMGALGGTVVHCFDLPHRTDGRRWAYDIVEETGWCRFTFAPATRAGFIGLLDSMLRQSTAGIWFYSDAQWSNPPRTFKAAYGLDRFLRYHDRSGIRMNTAIQLVPGRAAGPTPPGSHTRAA